MKQKLFLTSAIAMGFVAPVIAAPSHTDTFPDDGYMQEDYTYTNAATADNMDDVYEGTVNAVAEYDVIDYILTAGKYLPKDSETITTCPAGSYCSGIGSVNYNQTSAQGIETCPTNYTSEAGASAQNQCYQTCSASCTNPEIGAHVKSGSVVLGTETASGRNYYGSSCDAVAPVCSIQSYECDTGYHKYDPYAPTYEELITYIANYYGTNESKAKAEYPTYAAAKAYLEDDGMWGEALAYIVNPKKYGPSANENLKSKVSSADYTIDGTGWAAIGNDGNQYYTDGGKKQSDYGLTENGTWGTSFSYGDIIGKSKCTATSGIYWQQGDPDATTSGEAKYCWCQGTGIKGTNRTLQSLASSWVFDSGYRSASSCADVCAGNCAYYVQRIYAFRAALFGSAGASAAICEANTITINWDDVDPEYAGQNNEGTATYGEDVRTPVKANTYKGKTFKGWKFSKPEQTNLPE